MENGVLRLLPGFRFSPTDEELVVHYLKPKILSLPLPYPIPEANVCMCDPWDLPGVFEQERYFFSMTQTKYPKGKQSDRTAPSGYWRANGNDKKVFDSENNQIGTKKTLVFYLTKRPNGTNKTNWIMHEYKVANPIQGVQNWMICRVFQKRSALNDVMEDEGGSSSLTVAGEDEEIINRY